MSAVVDTSALIALDRLRLLQLLPMLFGDVYVPQAVVDEWAQGSDRSLEEAAALEGLPADWLRIRPVQYATREIVVALGRGEAEVIGLAGETDSDYVVLDDLAARGVAASRGLKVIGTVGVLIAARRRGIIPSAASLLEDLRKQGFRLSDEVLETVRESEERTAS